MSIVPTIRPIQLNNFELDVEFFLKKEYADIGEALIELPAVIEWINEQLQAMIESRELAKIRLRQCEADAFFELKRGLFEQQGLPGKMTDSAVDKAVDSQPSVIKAAEELAVLMGWVSRLTNLLDTFRVKFDLIRSTEATRRKEYDTLPS